MSDVPPPAPRLAIDGVRITGIDAATARGLGPAIEQALAAAARDGRLRPATHGLLRLDLPHGAGTRDIVAALLRALGAG